DAVGAGGGWAAARALASAADVQALAGRHLEAIPLYVEACVLLAAEVARTAKVAGISQQDRAARDSHHKVASMVQDVAVLAAQFGQEAPAIRLLQRAVEMHLSALEASGVLVPHFAGVNEHRSKPRGGPGAEATAAANEHEHGRGAGITYRAVMDDARPLPSRLWLQCRLGAREGGGSGGGGGRGGAGGNVPRFGRLDVVGTCVGDLGVVLACTRMLRQEQRTDESAQLAEKVFPVLKEILGADHAFTKTALAAFVGQGIVDECWSHADADGGAGHPTLPSPTSRRRQARSYGGRAASPPSAGLRGAKGLGGGSGADAQNATGATLVPLTRSELSVPPSPLPAEFYARYSSSSLNGASSGGGVTGGGGGGGSSDRRGRNGSGFSHNSSVSSGTEGDDGEDSDSGSGPVGGPRRAGPVGGGAYGRLSFPRVALSVSRQPHGWRMEGPQGFGQGGA
ncbi:unnamed protein product, partial [Scytosiphon promiscuus]